MQNSNDEYISVWETWDRITTASPQEEVVDKTTETNVVLHDNQQLRQRVQRARIEQRMSIATLAMHVTTTADVLSAFERGDGILDSELQKRVTKYLKL